MRLCQIDPPVDGFAEANNRPERHNASGINFLVRHVVVPLDVIDANGFGDSGLLIKIEQVTLQVRVIDDPAKIAFEMSVIYDVEPNQRAEETPIGFDDAIANK